MPTIVRGTVPADELALNHTLAALPDVEVECARIVKSGDDVVMPLLWIRNAGQDEVDEALAADPTIQDVTCLSAFEDEYLYRMQWIDHIELLLNMLTNGDATILDAYGRNDRWHLRVLYPNRDHLTQTHEFAADHQLTFDIDSIRDMEGEPAGRYGLTDDQYRALVTAVQRGYYDVPRGVTLEELADEFDVAHQSLSEQIRRGTGALIEDALMVGSFPDEE